MPLLEHYVIICISCSVIVDLWSVNLAFSVIGLLWTQLAFNASYLRLANVLLIHIYYSAVLELRGIQIYISSVKNAALVDYFVTLTSYLTIYLMIVATKD